MFESVALDTNFNSTAVEKNEPMTDAELVKEVLAGDETAFDRIFERYRRLVVHLVSRFFNRREIIEELSQQSFTKIYFSLKDFRGGQEKSFAAWASRLTINVCYDELRRRQRRPESVFADLTDDEANCFEKIDKKSYFDNEKAFIDRDLTEKLLSGLDAKDRLAITLFYTEEFTVAEVAEKIGWTESNVKIRLMRARNYLRDLLNKY